MCVSFCQDAIEQSELLKRVEGGSTGCHQVGVALGDGRRKRSDVGQKFPFSTFRPAGGKEGHHSPIYSLFCRFIYGIFYLVGSMLASSI